VRVSPYLAPFGCRIVRWPSLSIDRRASSWVVVAHLLFDVREVLFADEFCAALSLAGEAELVIRPVLDGRVGFAVTSWRAANGFLG
jgi:hypothetical protein